MAHLTEEIQHWLNGRSMNSQLLGRELEAGRVLDEVLPVNEVKFKLSLCLGCCIGEAFLFIRLNSFGLVITTFFCRS